MGMAHLSAFEKRDAPLVAGQGKVRRDQRWDEIRSRYTDEFGEIPGGGYVNDGTRRFMRAYAERYRALPPEARRSWPHPYVHDIIGDQRPPGPQMSLL